jgi:hypothetical protein
MRRLLVIALVLPTTAAVLGGCAFAELLGGGGDRATSVHIERSPGSPDSADTPDTGGVESHSTVRGHDSPSSADTP